MIVLKILWQLPQVIVGGLVWLFFKITNRVTNKKRDFTDHAEISYKSVKNWNSGVSLSEFFIFIDFWEFKTSKIVMTSSIYTRSSWLCFNTFEGLQAFKDYARAESKSNNDHEKEEDICNEFF